MLRNLLLLFVSLVFVGSANAQQSCSCTQTNLCSAAQTCTTGKAICTCSPTGCSSSCQDAQSPEGLTAAETVQLLENATDKDFSRILSAFYSKDIAFTPSSTFDRKLVSKRLKNRSDLAVLEYLETKGKLTINGHPLSFWKEMRAAFLKGGEMNICVGSAPVDMVVKHLEFISGKSFVVLSGSPSTQLAGSITGKGLSDLVAKIEKMANVEIALR